MTLRGPLKPGASWVMIQKGVCQAVVRPALPRMWRSLHSQGLAGRNHRGCQPHRGGQGRCSSHRPVGHAGETLKPHQSKPPAGASPACAPGVSMRSSQLCLWWQVTVLKLFGAWSHPRRKFRPRLSAGKVKCRVPSNSSKGRMKDHRSAVSPERGGGQCEGGSFTAPEAVDGNTTYCHPSREPRHLWQQLVSWALLFLLCPRKVSHTASPAISAKILSQDWDP